VSSERRRACWAATVFRDFLGATELAAGASPIAAEEPAAHVAARADASVCRVSSPPLAGAPLPSPWEASVVIGVARVAGGAEGAAGLAASGLMVAGCFAAAGLVTAPILAGLGCLTSAEALGGAGLLLTGLASVDFDVEELEDV